ncbi:hypothetical protein PMAYCL1PPCAC_26294, partial [Pristionchus mayeri]
AEMARIIFENSKQQEAAEAAPLSVITANADKPSDGKALTEAAVDRDRPIRTHAEYLAEKPTNVTESMRTEIAIYAAKNDLKPDAKMTIYENGDVRIEDIGEMKFMQENIDGKERIMKRREYPSNVFMPVVEEKVTAVL